MNKKESYNIVYTSLLNFFKGFLQFENKPEENLSDAKDFLNRDFIELKVFFTNLPYMFSSASYKKSLEKLNDNDLKEIIEDLKKDIGGKK